MKNNTKKVEGKLSGSIMHEERVEGKLSVSIMCADLLNIERQIRIFEKNHVNLIHVDIMDSIFVDNLTFGSDFINQMKRITSIPMEIHLMMNYPSNFIKAMENNSSSDIYIVHLECKEPIDDLFELAQIKGANFGIAIKPKTNITEVLPYLSLIDELLLLSVEPGFYGQSFIEDSFKKVTHLKDYLVKNSADHIEICVDGGMSKSRAKKMRELGVDIFVGGTAGIFVKNQSLELNIQEFKKVIL